MMDRLAFNQILETMLAAHTGIVDLFFSVGRPLQVEAHGELKPVQSSIETLTPEQTEQVAHIIVGGQKRLLEELEETGSCDCSYALDERRRFRVNVFRQRGHLAVVMRKLQEDIPSVAALNLPPIFQAMSKEKNGLILVTGATGSGKTTTLAALLNEINSTQAVHVVTLEDPIEFVHPHLKATFSQRELGLDFRDFPTGLRAALRQSPKVILVGEMRDRETVEIALTAAETGHLVLSTMHTISAGQTINRILGMFEPSDEPQLRLRLADSLRYVTSQRLVPKRNGGRVLVQEVMGSNLRTREAITLGESDARSFYEIIEINRPFGWMTFDQALAEALLAEQIDEETAVLYASRKVRMNQVIDELKKKQGLLKEAPLGLRLEH